MTHLLPGQESATSRQGTKLRFKRLYRHLILFLQCKEGPLQQHTVLDYFPNSLFAGASVNAAESLFLLLL